MNKYIVKNCPTLMGNRLCFGKTTKQCADCNDCIMKRIVKECTNSLKFSCERILAERLLGLLDIQEIK